MVRLGNTRPLPWYCSIGSIYTRKKLHPGVPPPTTEFNKGDICRSSGKTRHGAYLEYTQNIVLQHQGEDPTGLWCGQEKKKRRNVMTRKRVENREGSLWYPGIVTVKVSDRGLPCHEFEPSTTKDPPCRAAMENLSASSISNYDCILSPFFIPHPSERNAINIVQFSDKSTEDFLVICYTDGSKIDGKVGFAFVVFRSGVESENFQFRIRDECTVFVVELLCLNFAVK
ncbi:RNase H domain-containing protein [Trichonephila clavipes]|nr:RNase H domain-containing protein [Trichonephila clavipes]